ncbi:HD domain-containing protein 2 [Contarinia nasturtii]|uniref:HD domain-containing protein 2 n=1 Tax=Contarinia nasturtii TaxID=265458 RepID=UPI0012D3FACD|nr:HD domain-containing protein 2 [Contarinia nasturtii]
MLKVLRLTTDNLRNFSLFQFTKLFKQAAANQILHNTEIENATTMSAAETNGSSVKTTAPATAKTQNLDGIVKFLELLGNLKHLKRTGWVLRNVGDCETIAGHMYRMSVMTFLLDGKSDLDRTKCMELALVHDLAEAIVGDITPYCGVSKEEKKQREMDAMQEIAKLIAPRGQRLMELFEEYEENQTPESKFVKDLDRLDLVMQAFEYEKRDNCIKTHQEFFDSNDGKFNHPLVIDLVNEIKAQRESAAEKDEKQQPNHASANSS